MIWSGLSPVADAANLAPRPRAGQLDLDM